jgi:Arc/MetJ-type ribon-helix-helix transcriptional regulator
MPQAKFSLTEIQSDFLNQHRDFWFPDRSSVVRAALDRLRMALKKKQLIESAKLYAEVYSEEEELQELTEQANSEWPE